MSIGIEFVKEDIWVGIFYRVTYTSYGYVIYDFWICLVPCLPIHISFPIRAKQG